MELFPQDKWLVQGVLGHQQKGNEVLFANEATPMESRYVLVAPRLKLRRRSRSSHNRQIQTSD